MLPFIVYFLTFSIYLALISTGVAKTSPYLSGLSEANGLKNKNGFQKCLRTLIYFRRCSKKQLFCMYSRWNNYEFVKIMIFTSKYDQRWAVTLFSRCRGFFSTILTCRDLPSFSFSLTRMSLRPWISFFLDSFSPCQ